VSVSHAKFETLANRDASPLSYIPYMVQGCKHGLQDIGTSTLTALQADVACGKVRLELRSPSAQKEGGIHGLASYTR
jgi:IMP dehydrogenase